MSNQKERRATNKLKDRQMRRIPFPYIYSTPDTIRGANASHKFGMVKVRKNHPHAFALLAQEVAEEDYLALRIHIPHFILGLLFGLFVVPFGEQSSTLTVIFSLIWGIGFVTVGFVLFQKVWGRSMRKTMELRGQAIEAIVLGEYRNLYEQRPSLFNSPPAAQELDARILEQVKTLVGYWQFKGMTEHQILKAMMKELPWSLAWVESNRDWVFEKAKSLNLPKDPVLNK